MKPRVVVVGAGIAGLSAAIALASRGAAVTVLERASEPGGKMQTQTFDGRPIDCGPTVMTMKEVFEEIFEQAGASLEDYVTLKPLSVLARHAWDDPASQGAHLDLFADIERTVEAIAAFSSPAEGRRYRAFCARTAQVYQTLENTFMRSERPSMLGLVGVIGVQKLGALAQSKPFTSLWHELGTLFNDPRLRQLFARYATYCGSSPFKAPATLMLIAHAEQRGVWVVEGGMIEMARALARLATAQGAIIRCEAEVVDIATRSGAVASVGLASGERLEADAVVMNADLGAIADGRFGQAVQRSVPRPLRDLRSLSAVTLTGLGETQGFPLSHHNVFFSRDYEAEFKALDEGRMPLEPTIYICAQDRSEHSLLPTAAPERLFCILNAPAIGDTTTTLFRETEPCRTMILTRLKTFGLTITAPTTMLSVTTPLDFERRYPSTGGALYGQATHGWRASFQRPGSRATTRGLYLAGGSVHPGAGVPMAAISGRLAAQALLSDLASMRR